MKYRPTHLYWLLVWDDIRLLFAIGAGPLEEVDLQTGLQIALDAIENGRLALICGAGLSMSPPSNIPSAQALANRAKAKYDATHGAEADPLPAGIEQQAAFFYQANRLADYYFRTLIGVNSFSAEPNAAHFAVADLLLTGAADIAISTNVDRLIETAGMSLEGHIENAIDRERAAAAAPGTPILFKLHGCWDVDRRNTVWCVEQLNDAPLDTRIPESAQWLENRLLDRDLVVVGYFTHWEHLTTILDTAIAAVQPSRLIIVDPADAAWLEEKAPEFFALGERAQRFCHVSAYGDQFLDRLRIAFSKRFVRKVLHAGRQTYYDMVGEYPQPDWLEPGEANSTDLWLIRRDLEGCMPGDPAVHMELPNEPVLGLTILRFRRCGATWNESVLRLADATIRIFNAPNQALHALEAAFEGVTPPLVAETIVAVGAVDLPLKANVARRPRRDSITRGSGRRWITREKAEEEFGL